MPVKNYSLRRQPILQALLWTGNSSDLYGFAKSFPETVYVSFAGELSFSNEDGVAFTCAPHAGYLCLGITGYFFVVEASQFLDTYTESYDPQNLS